MSRKLIYILNHYSANSTQHFFHVLNLLEKIADEGVSINVIIEKSDGVPVINNNNIQVTILKKTGLARLLELYKIISCLQKRGYKKLFVRISNFAAIVAIINSFFCGLDVYYWHSGTVFGFDNEQPMSIKKVKWYFKTRLPFNFVKKYVTYFVTGPESMKAYYTNVVGVKERKIKILYNDIDTLRFNQISEEEKRAVKIGLNIALTDRVVLFVHKFSPVRKSKLYVKTFIAEFYRCESLKSFKFYFIGDGSDKKDIKAEIEDLGLTDKVFFLGALPNSVVHKYYQIADIFINPTYAEGFPRVLIEAMACGLPIVTTDAGGIRDILGHLQLAYMSDINDPQRFAENLTKMAKLSPGDLIVLKEENLNKIAKYSTLSVAKMYVNTIFND